MHQSDIPVYPFVLNVLHPGRLIFAVSVEQMMSVESSSSAVAQLNAQTAAANVNGKASHLSTMWTHVTKKFPELRNATQYYAYDVAKASRQVVEAAYTTVNAALVSESATAPPASPAAEAPGQLKEKDLLIESESHYVPTPSSVSRGLVVRHVELQRFPGTGGAVYLIVMLEKVGFAVFEVQERGVFEVFTDLSSLTDDVVAVQVLEKNEMLILRRNPSTVERITFPSTNVIVRNPLPNCAAPDALLRIGTSHIAITNKDFYQISVLLADTLEEQTTLYADNLVTASSQSLLAFCTLPDDSISHTKFSAKSAESTLQTVARNVSSLSKLLWGSTPQSSAQVQPLGAVSIYDVVSNEVIGSFSPHNHVIASLAFNGDGTILATASHVGTFINIFQILREIPHGSASYTTSVVLLARLHRGVTRAEICSLAFSPLNNYLAVGSAVGTCHIFPLGKIHSHRGTEASSASTAPQISAVARVRSAPCGSPVNPRLIFSSKVSYDAAAVLLTIVSAFGVVTTVRCSSHGISNHYSCYLDNFKGPRERDDVDVPTLTTTEISALHCNAQVELETYERCSPLENFWFGGGSPPQTEEQTLNGEWDDCVEVRQSSGHVINVSRESEEFCDENSDA
ncbi:Hypothetical protein, putative [Bodo saltans]|uniref:BCAS3 WD40 domain-containing protein n=2 Tax=Bodo saltans TaxID=75058 RepID=A0A0S4JTJ4_BODSA|nr:Hypothetical protein, putative [Bodo saltans]|eukprot:CUG93337.1 Hypothetical protein, putative [Bodo saltans]